MTFPVRHISIGIERNPEAVYTFISNPENLPQWAAGLSGSIKKDGETWIAESPMGTITIQFAEKNSFGVVDHLVRVGDQTFDNPMRVLKNESGSEVMFTLYRRPEMDDKAFEADAKQIETDLKKLKSILEK